MTPDLIDRIRGALLRYAGTLAADDNADAPAELETVAALIRRLPPDPGGAMPEPWPGVVVQDESGDRWIVTNLETDGPSMWTAYGTNGQSAYWSVAYIREIRTQDGRVLWRAGETK